MRLKLMVILAVMMTLLVSGCVQNYCDSKFDECNYECGEGSRSLTCKDLCHDLHRICDYNRTMYNRIQDMRTKRVGGG